jgi:hypothetical protein
MPPAENSLIKQRNRPEVYVVEGGKRHWIPDPETLASRWSWDDVQALPDSEVTDVPLGDPIASIVHPGTWPDGSLMIAPPAPEVYVVLGGERHWIPDPQTLFAKGWDWNLVETVSSSVLNAIPRGADEPSVLAADIVIDTGDVFLGAGHYMASRARMTRSTGDIAASTRTFTVTSLGGFHGGVYAVLSDGDDIPVPNGQTPLNRYGVDGRWIGRSDRTDVWDPNPFSISPDAAAKVVYFRVFHTWAPNDFQTVLDKWVAAGDSVAKLAGDVGAVAKVFGG